MEKKAKAEAKRARRTQRKLGEDPSNPAESPDGELGMDGEPETDGDAEADGEQKEPVELD